MAQPHRGWAIFLTVDRISSDALNFGYRARA